MNSCCQLHLKKPKKEKEKQKERNIEERHTKKKNIVEIPTVEGTYVP